jgi:uncharacterized caspase-like protein
MNELHYAVVVGVNRYPELDHLSSAVGDARKFAEWLGREDGGGVKPENLELIAIADADVPSETTRPAARPKKGEIHNALYKVARRCKAHVEKHPKDWEKTRLYVYVSGHGLAPEAGEAALLLADAGPDWFGENFPCAHFLRWYEAAQHFHEVVVFADCCRYWAEDAPLAPPPWTKVKGNNGKVVKMTGFATRFGDPAYEPPSNELDPPDQRRSYFTRALLEGLDEGQAVDPSTGRIDSNSLAFYLKKRVDELTRKNELTGKERRPQEPEVEAEPAEPIVFRTMSGAEIQEAKGRRVTIRFVTDFAGDVYLLTGTLRPLERREVSDQPWVVEVEQPGLYQVHPAAGDEPAPPGTANPFRNAGHFSVFGEDVDVEL